MFKDSRPSASLVRCSAYAVQKNTLNSRALRKGLKFLGIGSKVAFLLEAGGLLGCSLIPPVQKELLSCTHAFSAPAKGASVPGTSKLRAHMSG